MPSASGPRAQAVGDDFVLTVDANQGYTLRQAVEFSRLVEDQNIRWFEEPVRWYSDRLDMASARNHDRHPDLRRPERDQPRRLPRPDDVGRDRRLQFRCELGRRADRMAPRRRARLLLQRRDGATTRSRRYRRICWRSVAHGTFLETFHPDRDPLFYQLVANRSPFSGGWYQIPEGAGFGLELDAGVIAKYRVDGKIGDAPKAGTAKTS